MPPDFSGDGWMKNNSNDAEIKRLRKQSSRKTDLIYKLKQDKKELQARVEELQNCIRNDLARINNRK